MLDAATRVSGTVTLGKPSADLVLSQGTLGEKAVRWALERAGVPARFEPRTPLRFSAPRVAWAAQGALEADARIDFDGGPALGVALAWRPELFELRRLTLKDARTDAAFGATLAGELIQASFSGTLSGASIPAMLREPLPTGGVAKGAVRVTIDRKRPERTQVEGKVAIEALDLTWLTGKKARREVHRLRAGSDAVAVGLGTVRTDNPDLTVRDVPPPRVAPARVVFTRRGQLPLASGLARTATEVQTVVVAESVDLAHARRLKDLGVEIVAATSLDEALRTLRQRGIRSMLVEGGAGLTGALLGANLVDRLIIFQAPVVLGAGALPGFESAPPTAAARSRWSAR